MPVTVLSRCQRFDLRRVPAERLAGHFRAIAEQEEVPVDEAALAMIARAADGSVRDGLSLLDQAIALGDGGVTADGVRAMLGLADRTQVFDLFEATLGGRIADALALFDAMYRAGADPVVVMQDLLEVTHWLTRVAVAPEVALGGGVPEAERERGGAMAKELPLPVLARAWQMLLKGLGEVQSAPSPLQAAEMVLVRLAYMAELPSPADLVRELRGEAAPAGAAGPGGGNGGSGGGSGGHAGRAAAGGPAVVARGEPAPAPASSPAPRAEAESLPGPQSFAELVALFEEKREAILHAQLCNNVHLVRFEPGRLEFRPDEHASRDLAARIGAHLGDWTGRRWVVSVSGEAGAPTLAEEAAAAKRRELEAAARLPLVQAAQKAFPGARITRVTPLTPAGADTPPPGDDDTDTDADTDTDDDGAGDP